jgi:hypothetical protein
MPRIFICYRRLDSGETCGRIGDRLTRAFGAGNVFKDVDSLPGGADFRDHVAETIKHCDALLVLIGPDWLTAADGHGRQRLAEPEDYVRQEIELALSLGRNVVPVLVDGAALPKPEELPPSVRPLAFRQAMVVRADPDFHRDMDRLIRMLDKNRVWRRLAWAAVAGAILLLVPGLARIAPKFFGSSSSAPRLLMYHRVAAEDRRLVDQNHAPFPAEAELELDPDSGGQSFRYLLAIAGDGRARLYPDEDLQRDAKGSWHWQLGTGATETLIYCTRARQFSADELAELERQLSRLGEPKLAKHQQILWQGRGWHTVESDLVPRGQPLPAVSRGWADRVVAILNAQGLQYDGRTVCIETEGAP